MTTDRSYRDAMSVAEAREELRTCAGSQFDPEVVRAFLDVLDDDATPTVDGRTPEFDLLPGFESLARDLRGLTAHSSE